MKKRICPSKRKEDCGGNDTKKKNCETRPCPLWSDWQYTHTDSQRISLCWNEASDQQHYCYTDSKLRSINHESQQGTKTKFRDCQGISTQLN